jgi:mono/diheme cytochrome c family protein
VPHGSIGFGFALALALALAAGGCGRDAEAPESPAPPPQAAPESPPAPAPAAPAPAAPAAPRGVEGARAEARQIFEARCATCHGPQGAGNGPASAGLAPPPRNFQDPVWQKSVSDAHIEKIVLLGGAAVGKSALMPSNPDLAGKPEVVAGLREHVRGLAR